MRKLLLYTLAAALWLEPMHALQARDKDARALIEKAVQAQGGLDVLGRGAAAHRKTCGTFQSDGFSFTGESFGESSQRYKIVLRGTADNPTTRILVRDGDKGWFRQDDFLQELDAAYFARLKKSAHVDRVSGLVALLRDKGYTLSLLGESQIKQTAVVGVKVQSKGQADVSLYFDKATGLLLKSAHRGLDPVQNVETLQEMYYSDYKRVDPAARDEQILRAAKLNVEGPALLEFVRKRTGDDAARQAIQALIAKLGAPAFHVRQKASAALTGWGVKAAPQLRQALKHKDREVVRRAEQCLERLAQGKEPALTAAVLRLLAVRRPAGSAEVLLAYTPWALDENITRELLGALAAVAQQDGKPNPAIVKALDDPDAARRAAAAAVLGKDGGAYAKQPWRRVLLDGLILPRRSVLFRDGQKAMELETLEVDFFNRLDDSVFARP